MIVIAEKRYCFLLNTEVILKRIPKHVCTLFCMHFPVYIVLHTSNTKSPPIKGHKSDQLLSWRIQIVATSWTCSYSCLSSSLNDSSSTSPHNKS
nr:hypothetical protein CFP56_42931 [Quercus suber]